MHKATLFLAASLLCTVSGAQWFAVPLQKPKPSVEEPPNLDLYGDPLPYGALSRIGTVRFKPSNTVLSIHYLPDGKQLVSVGHDGVRLWDVRTGRQLRSASNRSVYRGAISPDGTRIWLQNSEGLLSVWDLTTQPDVGLRPVEIDGKSASFLAATPDGKSFVTGDKDRGGLRFYDSTTFKEVRALKDETSPIENVQFSRDGKQALTHTNRKPSLLWNVEEGKVIHRYPPEIPDPEQELRGSYSEKSGSALSPDGKFVAVSYWDQTNRVRVWEVGTGKELPTMIGNQPAGRGMRFSPDGKLLALGCQSEIRLCDPKTGKELWKAPINANQVFDITFSPDGKTIAAGLVSKVMVWDVASGREICPFPEHRHGTGHSILSSDGRTVTTCGVPSVNVPGSGAPSNDVPGLRHWDAATGQQMIGDTKQYPSFADISNDGKILAGWGKDNTIEIWDVPGDKKIGSVTHGAEVALLRLSPDGKFLLWGNRHRGENNSPVDAKVEVYLLEIGGDKGPEALEVRRGLLGATVFSPDGRLFAMIDEKNRFLEVWDASKRKSIHSFDYGKSRVSTLAFSPDGTTFAAGGYEEVRFWNITTGEELPTLASDVFALKTKGYVMSMAFSVDSKILFTGNNSGHLQAWNVATGELRADWWASRFRAYVAGLSKDGKRMLTTGDSTAIVWDLEKLLAK